MKLRSAVSGFALVTLLYLGVLLWLDSQRNVFKNIDQLWQCLPVLVAAAFVAFLLRYARWYWLLLRLRKRIPVAKGFLAYLSGFAFTATPGKVGELIRIRYFLPMGISPEVTLSAFIYERAIDLLVVLALSCFVASNGDILSLVSAFVLCALGSLSWFIHNPRLLIKLQLFSVKLGATRVARVMRAIRGGLSGCKFWLTPSSITISLSIGFFAWGLLAMSFVYLCRSLGIQLSLKEGIPIYPISMLAGAASMIPGGLGSTEATMIAILESYGSDFPIAVLSAVGIRLATLWFSIACGLLAAGSLEFASYRDAKQQV